MPTAAPLRPSPVPLVLKVGLIAGALDITAACVQYMLKTGNNPVRVLVYVSSGVFGKPALADGGAGYAIAGLVFHFLIALIFAAIFYVAWPVLKLLTTNRLLLGVIYGILVWAAMNLVVVPLSHVPQSPFNGWNAVQAALILIICIGLPIAGIIGARRSKEGN
jgi:putative exporter of polyketide antibiotics